jgi:SAM-dependent methyltransferase
MNDVTFTGERLHEGDDRFAIDIARHRAAYEFAREQATGGQVIDVGCGSGYGTAMLAEAGLDVLGFDRVLPDRGNRTRGGGFVIGDLNAVPILPDRFDLVVSFQVIEHFDDPSNYIAALADLCGPDGLLILTTPNIHTSDGVNPFHVHEYQAAELSDVLRTRFDSVEVRGLSPSERVRSELADRSRRIRRVMRIDPLNLRSRLPRSVVEWLFARFALLVRQSSTEDAACADVTWREFPIGATTDACLDLVALCRRPR